MQDESVYANIVKKHDVNANLINKVLKIVEQFIIDRRLILVGGVAIDMALKKKGSRIYEDDAVPDYDFLSPNFHTDAYDLAKILYAEKFPNVQAINAMHPSTMRIFVMFTSVADITYVPDNLYKLLPTLQYGKLNIIHPSFQYIDQHRSLSLPYEGAPRETILHRWEKDMKRHNLYYEKYPFPAKQIGKITSTEYILPIELIKNTCIGGFPGMLFWINKAIKMEFQIEGPLADMICRYDNNRLTVQIPDICHYVGFSDNLWDFLTNYKTGGGKRSTKLVKKSSRSVSEKTNRLGSSENVKISWANAVLDKLPRKVKLEHQSHIFEIFDNKGSLISAHKPWDDPVWIANLQNIMIYWLTLYFLEKKEVYISFYNVCHDIVKWAESQFLNTSDQEYIKFLPNSEVYGEDNWSDSYILYRQRLVERFKNLPVNNIDQPKKVYFKEGVTSISDKYYQFDPSHSPLYQFDGEKCEAFNPISLPSLFGLP